MKEVCKKCGMIVDEIEFIQYQGICPFCGKDLYPSTIILDVSIDTTKSINPTLLN